MPNGAGTQGIEDQSHVKLFDKIHINQWIWDRKLGLPNWENSLSKIQACPTDLTTQQDGLKVYFARSKLNLISKIWYIRTL